MCDLSGLPSECSKKVVSEIIDEGNYDDVQAEVTAGSEKGDNYMGLIVRVKITGTKNSGYKEVTHLVLKIPPSEDSLRSLIPVNKFYTKEVYAYEVVLPYFKKLQDDFQISTEDRFISPKCYRASSEEPNEYIIMEDLSISGFKMYDRMKSFDPDHLKTIVKNLARIHAFSFVLKQSNSKLFEETSSLVSNSLDFGDNVEGMFNRCSTEVIQLMDDEITREKLRVFLIGVYEKLGKYLDPGLAAPYNVICHGDSWTNNFLFKYEDSRPVDTRTLDWQLIRHASPVTDLAYNFCLCTDEATRAQVYPEIFDYYYDSLRSCLTAMGQDVEQCYPERVYKDHLKMIMPYGLIMALIALPITLSDRGEAPDIVDMLLEDKKTIENRVLSQNCIDRLRGLVRDFVKYELI